MRFARLGAACLAVDAVLTLVNATPSAAQVKSVPLYEVSVSGLIDPVNVDLIEDELRAAENAKSPVFVIQLDSSGAVVSDERLDALVSRIERASVPVAVWVGGAGSEARGEAFRLVEAADFTGTAPGTAIGPEALSAQEALDQGVIDVRAPVLRTFFIELDGRVLDGTTISTTKATTDENGNKLRQLTSDIRLAKLDFLSGMMHTAASPAMAYLFFVAGMLLIIFEFFTVGVGIASAVGTLCLVPAFYGFAVLPTRPIGIALLVLAGIGFAVDIQVGIPRFWTAVGGIALTAGSFLLYDGHSVPWLTLVSVVALTLVIVLAGMPSMVRTRFSTPTIGREWMIGEVGSVVEDVSPDGLVTVRDAPWQARTNRATPIAAGDEVVVSGIDGFILEVDPLEGAAKDYRDRK